MITDEPDVDHPVGVIYLHHEAVLVASNIEDHPTVTNDARAAVRGLDRAGLFQSLRATSRNHALSGGSASACAGFSQNSRSARRAIIRTSTYPYILLPEWEQRYCSVPLGQRQIRPRAGAFSVQGGPSNPSLALKGYDNHWPSLPRGAKPAPWKRRWRAKSVLHP